MVKKKTSEDRVNRFESSHSPVIRSDNNNNDNDSGNDNKGTLVACTATCVQ